MQYGISSSTVLRRLCHNARYIKKHDAIELYAVTGLNVIVVDASLGERETERFLDDSIMIWCG